MADSNNVEAALINNPDNKYQTLNVTNVAPMFPSTARNQYKKAFLRSSLGVVMTAAQQEKFMMPKDHPSSGSGSHIAKLANNTAYTHAKMGSAGYEAWHMKNNNSNISTIIDY